MPSFPKVAIIHGNTAYDKKPGKEKDKSDDKKKCSKENEYVFHKAKKDYFELKMYNKVFLTLYLLIFFANQSAGTNSSPVEFSTIGVSVPSQVSKNALAIGALVIPPARPPSTNTQTEYASLSR